MKVRYNEIETNLPGTNDEFISSAEILRFKVHLLMIQNPDKDRTWAEKEAKKWLNGGKR